MKKSAADYYKDLAKEGARQEQGRFTSNFYSKQLRKKPFPVNKILFVMVILLGAGYYFLDMKMAKRVAINLTKKDGYKNLTPKNISKLTAPLPEEDVAHSAGATTGNGVEGAAATSMSSNSAGDTNSDERRPEDDLVFIQGKYYKKTRDNVYIINGRRVFYVNNKHVGGNESGSVSTGGTQYGD